MLTMYLVTDELQNTCGAYLNVIDACKAAREQLLESKFLKDARTISVSNGNIDTTGYAELGAWQKRAGRVVPSFAVIKHWRTKQQEASLPHTIMDFWKLVGICPKCKGDKGEFEFSCADQGWVLAKECDVCKGVGKFVEPKVTKMKLIVRDTIYNDGGEGYRLADMDLEEGSGAVCLKCFRDIKDAYDPDRSQFRVEEDGRIIAIQVHGEMLWLDNVPPPEYFYPHYKKRQAENADARVIAQRAKDAYVAGLEAGVEDHRQTKLLARIAASIQAEGTACEV